MSHAAQKKILDNNYNAAIERVIGKLRETQRLHDCWEHMAAGSHGKKLKDADFTREIAGTLAAQENLESFEELLDGEAARARGALDVFA